MNKPPNTWKHYKKHPLNTFADGFYQKIHHVKGHDISAEFLSYPPAPPSMEQ